MELRYLTTYRKNRYDACEVRIHTVAITGYLSVNQLRFLTTDVESGVIQFDIAKTDVVTDLRNLAL